MKTPEPQHFDQPDKSCYEYGCTDDCPVATQTRERKAAEQLPKAKVITFRSTENTFYKFYGPIREPLCCRMLGPSKPTRKR